MTFIDAFLQAHYEEFGLDRYGLGRQWESILLTPRFPTSRHVVALVFMPGSREPGLVVKVPRQAGDNGSVRNEAAVLRELALAAGGATTGVPEVVGLQEAGPYTVLVETALTGTPLDPRLVAEDFSRAVSAGTEFVRSLPCTRSAPANTDWYERTVAAPLEALAALPGQQADTERLVERTHELLAPLRNALLPAVVEHGDLSHPNLFLKEDGGLQVVDWERSRTDGIPGHDLVFYLQYLSESNERAFSRGDQLVAFEKAFGRGGWALEPLQGHLEFRGVDTALVQLLVAASWARSAATLAYRLQGETGTQAGSTAVQAAMESDRDFWLWRHVVDRAA
jgi:aminoglycoside phosphotransferase